jgi:putative ABC transport system substrate-binding protein
MDIITTATRARSQRACWTTTLSRYVARTIHAFRGQMLVRRIIAKLPIVVALLMLTSPLAAEAQQDGRVYRIGIFGEKASDPEETRLWQGFRLALSERGWIEGKNILIEYRWAEGNSARGPEVAADLLRLKVDVIVTRGSRHVQPLKDATSSIPIVFLVHADPVALGHVASLARPGRNITGLTLQTNEIVRKQLEMLIAAVPAANRIAVLWNPDVPSHAPSVKSLEEAARALRLQLTIVGARSAQDLEGAFSGMTRERAQAVLVLSSADFIAARQRVAELAIRHRLPSMFAPRQHVEAGGLMSYGADFNDLFLRGAIYVDRILRGAKPSELPVEQASKFELVINLKTAKALGLTIPQSVLLRANQIIE